MMLKDHMGSNVDDFGSSSVTSTSPPRAARAAYGDDFTVLFRSSHPCNFFTFAPFPILIEDPEANRVRSVDL